MRNTQDEEVDLGLSLGLANYRATTDEIGAGVNANSDIAFTAPDPVSELVWSPHNGLSLKCKEKLFILWNVGPGGEEEPEVNLNVSPVMLGSDRDFGNDSPVVGDNYRKVDEAGPSNPVLADARDNYEGVAETNDIADRKGGMDIDAKLSCKPMARKCFGGYACKSDFMGLNVDNFGHRASKISEDLAYSLPNIKSREEPDEEVTSGNRNNEIIPESPVPIDAIPLDKLECCAENDLAAKDFQSLGGRRHADMDVKVDGIFLNQHKGKEKVFSEENQLERAPEDDSNESVESCNNVGFSSRGVKRQNYYYEETSCSGSKRARTEGHGSFTNWMSNMLKGLSCGDKEDNQCSFPLSLALARSNDFTCKRRRDGEGTTSKGFKKVFRSLYCHMKMFDAGEQKEGYFIEEPEQVNTVEQKLLENHPLDGNDSPMQIIVSNKEVGQDMSRNISNMPGEMSSCEPNCASLACEGHSEKINALNVLEPDSLCQPFNKNNHAEASNLNQKCNNNHTSLWITRFCSRNVALDEHDQEISKEDPLDKFIDRSDQKTSGFCHDPHEYDNSDFKLTSKVSPLVRSQKARSPDEMASTFMRRLDALRQGSLHRRQLCDGKENISNYDVREEKNHDHEPSHEACGKGKALLRSFSTYLTWNLKDKSDNNRPLDLNGIQEGAESTLEIRQKDGNIIKEQPRSEFLATPEMFRAISKLWLSRSDILRWMNSNISIKYLNGFFLRLRLGKLEEGASGTSYYVACIATGDKQKHNGLKCKKSILVDVGGIKTCIESQYISNHDFLEDEIKAWWCKTRKNGGKIPSLHDLNSKFEDRKYLGF